MKTTQDITMDILKNNSRVVDFGRVIREQQEFVKQAKRFAGSKPSKAEALYIEEQQAKLDKLEDIVRDWITEAFEPNDIVVDSLNTWRTIEKHFEITVVVEKKL
jgi:hypothetical protein